MTQHTCEKLFWPSTDISRTNACMHTKLARFHGSQVSTVSGQT